jgi:dCMP deaminase
MNNKWNKRWMEKAQQFADWSKDNSHKVGCVIVDTDNRLVSQGYNGFPNGVNDEVQLRFERPHKYDYTEHAERNAIYNAARMGTSTKDCTLFTQLFPCVDCARGIIQSGITKVVTYAPDYTHPKWGPSWKISLEILEEAGVAIELVE